MDFKYPDPSCWSFRFRTEGQLQKESHGSIKTKKDRNPTVEVKSSCKEDKYKVVIALHDESSTTDEIRLSPHSFIEMKAPRAGRKCVEHILTKAIPLDKGKRKQTDAYTYRYEFSDYGLCKTPKKSQNSFCLLKEKYKAYYRACNISREKSDEDIRNELDPSNTNQSNTNCVRLGFTLLKHQNGAYEQVSGPLFSDVIANTDKNFAVELNLNTRVNSTGGDKVGLLMKSTVNAKDLTISINSLAENPVSYSLEKSGSSIEKMQPGSFSVFRNCVVVIVVPKFNIQQQEEYTIDLVRTLDNVKCYSHLIVEKNNGLVEPMPQQMDVVDNQLEPQHQQPRRVNDAFMLNALSESVQKNAVSSAIDRLTAQLKAAKPFDSPQNAVMFWKKWNVEYSGGTNRTTIAHDAIGTNNFMKLYKLDAVHESAYLSAYMAECTNCNGDSLLHYACITQKSDVIRPLIRFGCRIDMLNLHHDTALHLAIRQRYNECVSVFVKLIQTLDTPLGYPNVAEQLPQLCRMYDKSGQTIQHLAVQHGYDELIKALLEYNRKNGLSYEFCGVKDLQYGNTIAHIAVSMGNTELAKTICEFEPAANDYRNYKFRTCWEIDDDDEDDDDDELETDDEEESATELEEDDRETLEEEFEKSLIIP